MKPLAPVLLLALTLSASARSADSLVLSGTEWSRFGTYSYLGAITPLGGGSLGDGWVMRQWVDRLTYQYRSGTSDVHAEGYGYAPAFGRQLPIANSHIGLYGAVRIAHTSLDPDDHSNVDRGTHARFSIQAEDYTRVAGWAENQLIASAEIGNGGYFARDRFVLRGPGGFTLGPEVVAKGNRQYDARQFGLALGGLKLGTHVALVLRGGVSDQRGQPSVGYGSIELALTH
jgi:hypothetical protein